MAVQELDANLSWGQTETETETGIVNSLLMVLLYSSRRADQGDILGSPKLPR